MHTLIHQKSTYVYRHISMYICVYGSMYICVYGNIYVYVFTHLLTYNLICMKTETYSYIYMCVCIYAMPVGHLVAMLVGFYATDMPARRPRAQWPPEPAASQRPAGAVLQGAYTEILRHNTYTHIYICIYTYRHICMCICVPILVRKSILIYLFLFIFTFTRVCIFAFRSTRLCTFVHFDVYIDM